MVRATITLYTSAPFRLDFTVWALRRRRRNVVDSWDGAQYSRVIVVDGAPLLLAVSQEEGRGQPALNITMDSATEITAKRRVAATVLARTVLGLDADLHPFYDIAGEDPVIGGLVKQFLGVRPPRFPSIFEALINAVACQQVSLDLGIALLNRLSERFGRPFADRTGVRHAFPAPVDLAGTTEESIKVLGFSRQKARVIKELSVLVADAELDLTDVEGMSNARAVEYLSTIRGIGRWSAEYVLLRGLGRVDTFPGDDVGAQNNLQRLFELGSRPAYADIRRMTSTWDPYAGLVYFHLLLQKLHVNGAV